MVVMPDVLKTLIDYLNSAPGLSILDPTISPDLKGFEIGSNYLRVREMPGVRIVPDRLDALSFDINCYAASKGVARQLAHTTLAVVCAMKNYSDGESVITKVNVDVTPFDLTDEIDNAQRYVFSVTLFVRPA